MNESMNELEKELLLEKSKLEKELAETNKTLKLLPLSDIKIKASIINNNLQCYIKKTNSDKLHYLPNSDMEKASKIVKREYYCKLKDVLEKRIGLINRTMRGFERLDVRKVYDNIGKGKQMLVDPIEKTNEEYIEEWLQYSYNGKSFGEDAIEIYTEKEERVRSKSEKIIADKLYKENIPYRYECPLIVRGLGTIYPDFTILDVRYRRNIILEHFGMMDDEEYANKAIAKIQTYAREGYILGDNLFITMETSEKPLDSRVLDGIIKCIKNR